MNHGALCSRVQKFFEIKIDHDRVARSDVSLCLGPRLVGGSPRREAIAVLGERWVPPLLENLQQGLLDLSIDDARDAELFRQLACLLVRARVRETEPSIPLELTLRSFGEVGYLVLVARAGL